MKMKLDFTKDIHGGEIAQPSIAKMNLKIT